MDAPTSSEALRPVWQPSGPADLIPMNQYRHHVNNKHSLCLKNTKELQQWSVDSPQEFWVDLWSYVGMIPALPGTTPRAYDERIPIDQIPRFFENVKINYTENVLTQPELSDSDPALIGLREGLGLEGDRWSWGKLREQVRQLRSSLQKNNVKEGDRVAALTSTSVWSVAMLLAAASLGAVFTSIASDLGTEGCVSRLQLVEPTIIFADSHVTYKGTRKCNIDKVTQVVSRLDKKPLVVIVPLADSLTYNYTSLPEFLAESDPKAKLEYTYVSFSAPLYILYSSGTSGPPKCLVHQHGVVLQHLKTSKLHNSLKPGEVVFQYSSPSWVLWNIMVGHLAAGTTLVLYDGSPVYPKPEAMLSIVEAHKVAYWGASPRYLQQLQSRNIVPKEKYDLSSLRMVQTGGSHLAENQYYWFYDVFPRNVHLTSVTGGTDIATSWCGTDPAGPLYAGEIQIPMLGMAIDIADPVTGESVKDSGIAGEMICRKPFPSMPVFFWGDNGNKQYRESYFERFDIPVWAQHDWASFNPTTNGCQIHGRSDGVLNPQGIRFGSSEIYSITEAAPFDRVIETTLCVGRTRKGIDSDESVFLFVVMRDAYKFTAALESALREAIRSGLTVRHVPRFIVPVKDIPMTVNSKKIETLVKKTICTGKVPSTMSNTVANPGCVTDFVKFYDWEREQPVIRARL